MPLYQEELAGGELEKDARSKDNGLQPPLPLPSSREGDFRIHVTSPIIAITANQSWGIPRFNVSREIYRYIAVIIVDAAEEKEKREYSLVLRQPIFHSVPPQPVQSSSIAWIRRKSGRAEKEGEKNG